MTGPGLALIIIPIATTAGLVVWLIMVFSADGQPRQADRELGGMHASISGRTAKGLPTAAVTATRPIEAAASGALAGSSAPRHDPRIRQPLAR
jgi:hypothetical protein